jgi:hypothetical protein
VTIHAYSAKASPYTTTDAEIGSYDPRNSVQGVSQRPIVAPVSVDVKNVASSHFFNPSQSALSLHT